jgi:ribosome-associated heat shock protein Hsp15
LIAITDAPQRAKTRLDQWLWFTRLVKSRSLAARLCTAEVVTINDSPVTKANQAVRVGDLVVLALGGVRRTVRVLALGTRRGPAGDARTLYEEAAPAARLPAGVPDWVPLLDESDPAADSPIHLLAPR